MSRTVRRNRWAGLGNSIPSSFSGDWIGYLPGEDGGTAGNGCISVWGSPSAWLRILSVCNNSLFCLSNSQNGSQLH